MSFGDSPAGDNPYQSPQPGPDVDPQPTAFGRTAMLLRETRPWVRFLGILGLITVAFMLVAGLGMLVVSLVGASQGEGTMAVGPAILICLMYIVMAVLYIFPSVYLLRYASRISTFIDESNVATLDGALEAQKSFWKFVGIMIAIAMAFYGIGLVLMLIGLAISSMAT